MADSHHPLKLGTTIRFGSLEFMALGNEFDKVSSRLSLSSIQAPVAALLDAGGKVGATTIVPHRALCV
jgi:hypothetical protein